MESLLVFKVGKSGRLAVPLADVHRLEEFPRSNLESVGDHDVILYRERIISIIHLSELLKYRTDSGAPPSENLQVIVFRQNQKILGLVVDQIVDIVDDYVHIQERDTRPGIVGPAIIQGKVTEMIDLPALVRMGCPNFVNDAAPLALTGPTV